MGGNQGWSNQTARRLVVVEGTEYTGLFFYEPTAAAGNLVGSWTAEAGTDPYGNVYLAGATSYNLVDNTFTQLFDGMLSVGQIVAGTPDTSNAATFTYVAGAQPFLQIASALAPATYTDNALLLLQPGQPAMGSTGVGRPLALVIDNDASSACDIGLSGGIYATPLDGSSKETWHTMALATGFTTNVADQAPRYRLEPEAHGVVRLDGTVYSSAATALHATIATLPPEYWPKTRKRWTGPTNASGYTVPGQRADTTETVDISTTGVITAGAVCSAAGQEFVLDGWTYPLD